MDHQRINKLPILPAERANGLIRGKLDVHSLRRGGAVKDPRLQCAIEFASEPNLGDDITVRHTHGRDCRALCQSALKAVAALASRRPESIRVHGVSFLNGRHRSRANDDSDDGSRRDCPAAQVRVRNRFPESSYRPPGSPTTQATLRTDGSIDVNSARAAFAPAPSVVRSSVAGG